MTRISDIQEFARRYNEEEAMWQRFHEKRLARRFPRSDSPLLESLLDHLDWLEAARESGPPARYPEHRAPSKTFEEVGKYDRQFRVVFDAIRQLMSPARTGLKQIGFGFQPKK